MTGVKEMQVICNIQAMAKKCGIEYSFHQLASLELRELRNLQDSLIPDYNNAVKEDKE